MRDKEPLERTSFSHTGLSSLWSALKPLVVSSRQKLLAGLTVQMIPVLPATLPLETAYVALPRYGEESNPTSPEMRAGVKRSKSFTQLPTLFFTLSDYAVSVSTQKH
jgi:hypothetical protein